MNDDDILELPIDNPYKEEVIDYLTGLLVDAYNDDLLSIFLVGERADGIHSVVCWTSSINAGAFNAVVLKNALRKMGLTDREDIHNLIQDELLGGT